MKKRKDSRTVLQAQAFVVRDTKGRIRAKLGIDAKDVVSLKLLDKKGQTRAHLYVAQDGTSSLALNDDVGKPRVGLSLQPDQPHVAPVTLVLNGSNKSGILLFVSEYGPSLDFVGPGGKTLLELPKAMLKK